MNCPDCGARLCCKETRKHGDDVERVRVCAGCGQRVKTTERINFHAKTTSISVRAKKTLILGKEATKTTRAKWLIVDTLK